MTVYELTNGLRRAASDDRVRALVLHLESVDWGWARIAEVREAILCRNVGQSGQFGWQSIGLPPGVPGGPWCAGPRAGATAGEGTNGQSVAHQESADSDEDQNQGE